MKKTVTTSRRAAVFLDRDGVIVPDEGLLNDCGHVRLLDGVPDALTRLRNGGFDLVVITNQPIIARGLAVEDDVIAVNETIRRRIEAAGGPPLAHFYFCPHHPRASVDEYRIDCDCRKPKPGLLRRAAAEHGLDLRASYMIGDRITDIIAGAAAGCQTVLIESGRHLDPPIETSVEINFNIKPGFICVDLGAAAEWIVGQ